MNLFSKVLLPMSLLLALAYPIQAHAQSDTKIYTAKKIITMEDRLPESVVVPEGDRGNQTDRG